MTDYGEEFEDTHENMHIHRRERHYSGHKLSVGVGHNEYMRHHGGASAKTKGSGNKTAKSAQPPTGSIEQG